LITPREELIEKALDVCDGILRDTFKESARSIVVSVMDVVTNDIREKVRDQALKAAAERALHDEDEMDENDAAGLYMTIRWGGDTDRPEDWREAYRIARLDRRPKVK
jgi:hypothetical protein